MLILRAIKKVTYVLLPLAWRKGLAIWLDRQSWLANRHELSMLLIRDWAEKDVNAYHKFLWSEHLGYAKLYDSANSFGAEKILPSRRLLFEDLLACLQDQGLDPARDVRSIFEVGCSQGYLLRYAETELFPAATEIAGIDIDGTAIEAGKAYLTQQGSKIRLERADMSDLANVLGKKSYDVILCAGVLLYLKQPAAEEVVRTMVGHARYVVAIAGIGHPVCDNALLTASEQRPWDAGMIHNIDAMVEKAGGKVLLRRWEGAREINGQRIHFVFASGEVPVAALKPASSPAAR